MEKEAERALINGLTAEKEHLQMNLKENIEVKEKFRVKCTEMEKQMESMFRELVVFKNKQIGIE